VKTKTNAVLIMCCVFLSVSCLAQSSASCSPVGTWYGGSDVKYLMTITPITGERFSTRAEVVLPLVLLGYPAWTSWSGEFNKSNRGRYVVQEISMYTSSTEVPPPANSYEVDAVRGSMQFIDCDNIKMTYDFYGLYFDLNKVPFVDPPDVSVDAGGIVETYRRMPSICPVCGSPAKAPLFGRKKH